MVNGPHTIRRSAPERACFGRKNSVWPDRFRFAAVIVVMEARRILAYLILAAIVAALALAWRYATRDHRAHRRGQRAALRRARERLEEADRPS